MSSMHEEVHAEADGQWEQERQGAEDMGAMFDPEEYPGDSQEHAESKPCWCVQKGPLAILALV